MNGQAVNTLFTAYTIPLYLTSAIALVLLLIASQRHHVPAARIFVLLASGIMIWAMGYALEFIVRTQDAKLFWAQVQYFGITLTPVSFLLFTQNYLGFEESPRWKTILATTIIPLITIIAAWTNEWHFLLWTTVAMPDPKLGLDLGHGPVFVLIIAYSYLLLLTGCYYAWQALQSNSYVRRRQAAIILIGAMPPWLGNLVYILNLTPQGLDLTPINFSVTCMLIAYGLFRYELLNVVPIARNRVIENLADAVFVIDALGRVIDLNPAAAEWLGKSSRQVLASAANQALADFPVLIESLSPISKSNLPIRTTIDGEERTYYASTSLLRDPKENLQGWILTLHDITKQERNAQALRNSETTLHSMVQQLQEFDQLKTRFLHNVNHELRTPLTNIVLYADLLRTGHPEKHERYLGALERQTIILRRLIEQTLALERVEQMDQTVRLNLESTDLTEIVNYAMNTFVRQVSQAGLSFQHELPTMPVWVLGDHRRLTQVLNDLVVNAINFTPAGGTISLRLYANGQSAHLVVKDTGIGIAPEEQELIFERFYRGENAQNSPIPGLGLGLSAAKEIIELHGGKISVESQLAEGSTFLVQLPLKDKVEE